MDFKMLVDKHDVDAFLTKLQSLDVKLSLKDDGGINCNAPKNVLTPEIKQQLIAFKQEIINFLAQRSEKDIMDFAGKVHANCPHQLSFSQQRMLMAESISDSGNAKMPLGIINLKGEVNRIALQKALEKLIDRHKVLNSYFQKKDAQYVVKYHLDYPSIAFIDLATEPNKSLKQIIEEEQRRQFSLFDSCLFHVVLVKTDHDTFSLILSMHHAITDGWSTNIFINEIFALYNANVSEQVHRLAPLKYSYQDYAQAQNEWLKSDDAEKEKKYWLSSLSGYRGTIKFPEKTHFNKVSNIDCKTFISPSLTTSIRYFCQSKKVSPFAMLFAIFNILIARYSGQKDLVIGTPNAGRSNPDLQSLIGCFINHAALRTSVELDLTFQMLVNQCQTQIDAAVANQKIPFELILAELNPPRIKGKTPLFNVYFNYQNEFQKKPSIANAKATSVRILKSDVNFDLTFYVHNIGPTFELSCTYNEDIFSSQQIEQLLASYKYLADQVTQSPDCMISQLKVGETPAILNSAEGTNVLEKPSNILEKIFSTPTERLSSTAIHYGNETISYFRLYELSAYYGQKLKSDYSGGPVAIVASREPALVVGMLAAMIAGRTFSLIPIETNIHQISRQLEQISPAVVLLGKESMHLNDVHQLSYQCIEVDFESLASTDKVERINSIESFAIEKISYLSFTSGSEGAQKVVRGNDSSWLPSFNYFNQSFELNEEFSGALLSGIGHDPLHRDVLMTLARGACIFIPTPVELSPQNIVNWLHLNQVRVLNLTPSLAKLLLKAKGEYKLSNVKLVLLCGENLTVKTAKDLQQFLPHAELVNMYGATETQQVLSFFPLPKNICSQTNVLPVANKVLNGELYLVSSHGAKCVVNEPGEVVVNSPYIACGYLDNTLSSTDKFSKSPYLEKNYKTGDLGIINEHGQLLILGRKDRQLKINGYRVEPAEIEHALMTHESIVAAKVLCSRSENSAFLRAFIQLNDAGSLCQDQLRDYLCNYLPTYMLPNSIVSVDTWPMNSHGKIDDKALLSLNQGLDVKGDVKPRNQTEEYIHSLWCQALKREKISINQNFYQAGGQSIQAAEIIVKIEEQYQVSITLKEFLMDSTIERIAEIVRSQRKSIDETNKSAQKSKNVREFLI